jgi:MFS family permease
MRQVPTISIPSRAKKNILRPLFAVTLLDNISFTIGFPILIFLCFDPQSTLFAQTVPHSTRSFWYGLCSALPHLLAIAAAPILSLLSDYYGRKKILIFTALGAFGSCVFTSLSILWGTMSLLIIGTVIAGICTRTQPIAMAVVADASAIDQKLINMGRLQFYISIGAFLGPLLGGFLAHCYFRVFNFALPYIFGAAIALIATGITWRKLTESYIPKTRTGNNKFAHGWRIILNSTVIKLIFILGITQISWRLYYLFMPPFLKINFHYSPAVIGVFTSLIAIWLALASWLGIKFLTTFWEATTICRGACIAMAASFLLLFGGLIIPNAFPLAKQMLLWLSAIPMATGDVIVFSTLATFFSQAATMHDQGKIMGICFVIVSLVWAGTGMLGGALIAINPSLPLLVAPIPLLGLFWL